MKKLIMSGAVVIFVALASFGVPARAQEPVALARSLTVGSKGLDVSALQQFLKDQMLFDYAITGYFGSITKAAVVAFQRNNGIDSIGIVGPITRAKIKELTTYVIYTTHPGFVTAEAFAEFEKTKQTCVGRSEPIPGDARLADGPSTAKCFGYLTSVKRPACVRGGCSGQLCIEEGNQRATTCEYGAEYACYRTASCERQGDGSCGWTQTNELKACLANPPALN